jgi:hypothetical protein
MKHKLLTLSLVLPTAIILGACSAQAATMEAKPEAEMASESGDQGMEGEGEEMMSEDMSEEMSEDMDDEMSTDDAMEKDREEMSEDMDEAMMEDKDEMSSEGEMMEADDEAMDAGDGDMVEGEDESMEAESMNVPDWFKAELADARSGGAFKVSDFQGKVVLVETLAMWCSNCLKQQKQVLALHDLLGERDDFVSLGIDIDPNENATALKTYIEGNGFDWLYTVAPREVAREIGQLYGDQFLNPPSTPMLIIDRHGEVHILPFGIKSAESLLEALQPFLDGEM